MFRPLSKFHSVGKIALLGIFLLLSSIAHGKDSVDNRILVCEHGLEMLEWDLRFIKEAKQSIDISACFFGGKVLQDIADAIEERILLYPNIQVYILACPALLEHEDSKRMTLMQKKYPLNFHFQLSACVVKSLPDFAVTDNHLKCLIVDEWYFSTGGTNLDEVLCSDGSYTPPRNHNKGGLTEKHLPAGVRDQDVVGVGPLAKELRKTFHKHFVLWENYLTHHKKFVNDPDFFEEKSHYFNLESDEKPFVEIFEAAPNLIAVPKVKLICSGPMHSPNHITEEYISLLNNAKNEVVVGNLYFSPIKKLFSAFTKAANRGVNITLVTNGGSKKAPVFNQFFCWLTRSNYIPLFYGKSFLAWEKAKAKKTSLCKTRIFEYGVDDILYHKKVMVVDKRYTLIGSYNLGERSDSCDYELVLMIDSKEIAKQCLSILQKDIALSNEVLPSEALDWYFDPVLSCLAAAQKKCFTFL